MFDSGDIKVIHSPTNNEPFIIIDKPSSLPSAPLKENDDSALTRCLSLFPECSKVIGKKPIEKGLIHRIDTETSGIIMVAYTQEFYDYLINVQTSGGFYKWYKATVDDIADSPKKLGGFPSCKPSQSMNFSTGKTISVESCFRPYGLNRSSVRPVDSSSGKAALKKCGTKLYSTEIERTASDSVVCKISLGYRHQVRCHLSWCGLPIVGDSLYNPLYQNQNAQKKLEFRAFKIAFPEFEFEID